MNIYVVVEGERTEKLVYKKWIKVLNPRLKYVNDLSQVVRNNYVIYAGFGYPFYLEVIAAAVEDVNSHGEIDRLVIAVDSDEMSYNDKYTEIESILKNKQCYAKVAIVVQHFCLETWALGNKALIKRQPQSERLKEYLKFYNVVQDDPENLPAFYYESLNRAQFAVRYLKAAVNERYRNLTYSKSNPKVLLNQKFFRRVRSRFDDTGHIASFGAFLKAFK